MYKNIVHIPVFICGATAAALGIAHTLGDKVFAVERSGFAGREFADCYNPGENLSESGFDQDTEKLRAELESRNILADYKMHIQGVAPVIFNRIKEENLKFLFLTEVTDVKAADTGYEVTVYNNSGFRKFHAGIVIDTTSLCETNPMYPKNIITKSINATLSPANGDAAFPKSDNPLITLIQGRFEDEIYLKYQLEIDDDWVIARKKIHNYWVSREAELKDWNIAAIASSFDIKTGTKIAEIEKGWLWCPSNAYSNVLEAYDSGISIGRELVNCI